MLNLCIIFKIERMATYLFVSSTMISIISSVKKAFTKSCGELVELRSTLSPGVAINPYCLGKFSLFLHVNSGNVRFIFLA